MEQLMDDYMEKWKQMQAEKLQYGCAKTETEIALQMIEDAINKINKQEGRLE